MAKTSHSKKKPRLSDIAKKAAVSVPTVSLALANHPRISLRTKRLVWRISEEIGYQVSPSTSAAALKQSDLGIRRLGLLINGDRHDDPVMNTLMMCLTAAASRLRVTVEMACLTDPNDAPHTVRRACEFASRQDGLVVTGRVDQTLISELSVQDVPFVVLGTPVGNIKSECVTYNGEEAGTVSTSALIRQGHTRIGYISESMPAGGATHHWYQGYQLALLDAGLNQDPRHRLVLDQLDVIIPLVEALMAGPNVPTALVVPNPFMAQTILGWLHEQGKALPITTMEVQEMLLPAIQELPAVIISLERLVEYTLRRLLDLCIRGSDVPLMTYVPFEQRGIRTE